MEGYHTLLKYVIFPQMTELTVYENISVDFLTLVSSRDLCEDESDTDLGLPLSVNTQD